MLISDVLISGVGFHLRVSVTDLTSASKLVEQVILLRSKGSEEALPFHDGDNHLSGFVVPSVVTSMIIEHRPADEVSTSQLLLEEQLSYYRRLNAKLDEQ